MALLPTISFPAFATHEEVLYNETKANIVCRLKGNYGFKRFGRDGYKTVLEDKHRRYYKSGEIKVLKLIIYYISQIIRNPVSYLKTRLTCTLIKRLFLQDFDSVENEWPLFYIFMIIDGVFKSLPEQVEEYQNLLKARIHKDQNGGIVQ